jgi:aryl-alcohol dehydrogenase-like predicted oxidoreductase
MKSSKLNRRHFLKSTSLSALGMGLIAPSSAKGVHHLSSYKRAEIKLYRKFGRTGFNVSDISSGDPKSEAVLKALLESGVNLIDTAEVYANGNSERLIGKVIKDFNRNDIFINTKLYINGLNLSRRDIVKKANQCLDRLETEYVDCMQIHSAENTAILKDDGFHAGMEQLKKEGKVRHVGVSCHGNNWAYNTEENLEKILLAAVEDGRFDVILLAYNFINADRAERVLEACDKKNIATIIMKSNPIQVYGLLEDKVAKMEREGKEVDEYTKAFYDKYKIMQENAYTFFKSYGIANEKEVKHAASKYVLSNPLAHTTIWDFRNFDDVIEMMELSGQTLTQADSRILSGYLAHFGTYSCRIGCNDCEKNCPHHLPVSKIMRYNYYFSAKGQEKRAMEKYARLNNVKPSEVCVDCEGQCEKVCSYGVHAKSLLVMAQRNMELVG